VIVSGFQPSGTDEWIELFNTTSSAIALDNLELIVRIDANGDGNATIDWQLPAGLLNGATIAPQGFFLLREGSGPPAGDLTGALEAQRSDIESIRQGNEDKLDALAIRIAQMNARMIRLDALGRRLTEMAEIDDGEFNFDNEPAMGGPEEPMSGGSGVAVPEIVDAMASLDTQLENRQAQLEILEAMIMNQNLKDRVYPQGRPVGAGWISSFFGKRTDPFTGKPANHTGVDFAGKLGAEIVAAQTRAAAGNEQDPLSVS